MISCRALEFGKEHKATTLYRPFLVSLIPLPCHLPVFSISKANLNQIDVLLLEKQPFHQNQLHSHISQKDKKPKK